LEVGKSFGNECGHLWLDDIIVVSRREEAGKRRM